MVYGLPTTVSPAVRAYVAVTVSAARKPVRVPVKLGSAAPYSLVAASGVTEAAFRLTVKLRSTFGAASKIESPACEARTVQRPWATM